MTQKRKDIAWHRKDIAKNWDRVKVVPKLDPELSYYTYRRRKK